MKTNLAIIGQGAVTPAGIGIEAVLHREPVPTEIELVGKPGQRMPALRVDLKDPAFDRWQREPRLRRASPITFFLVEAAAQALTGLDATQRAETGLVVAFSAGCVAYSRRFFEGIITQGQRAASPALFPETVFNSPVSHVATVFGFNGAAYAVVGDETAWISALQVAATWLKLGRVKQALVLGVEEFDPLVLDAYRSAHWLARGSNLLASEGAAGVLVRTAEVNDRAIISETRDGIVYRSKKEAAAAAHKLISESDSVLPIHPSAQRNWFGELERKATWDRTILPENACYLGEAFTASAAWQTLRALHQLSPQNPRLLVPVWGLNHQVGSIEIASAA